MPAHNNLLLRLHKLIVHQDENFFTESLVHLLTHLLRWETATARRLLHDLTGGLLNLSEAEMEFVEVSTQVTTSEGRPDIELRLPDHLVYIEVKVESGLGDTQLERYRKALKSSGFAQTFLILLTQYQVEWTDSHRPDAERYWYQIADRLEQEVLLLQEPVSRYLVEQFLLFLQERGIVMEQVRWELEQGTQAFTHLIAMMVRAVEEEKRPFKRLSAWEWKGVSLSNQFYFYVAYADPTVVVFRTYEHKIDKSKAEQLGFGRVWEEKSVGWRWEHTLNLAAEEVHFFARTKASQFKCICDFLVTCLTLAEQMQASGSSSLEGLSPGAASPEEGEEDLLG